MCHWGQKCSSVSWGTEDYIQHFSETPMEQVWSQTYKIKDHLEQLSSLLTITPRRRCPDRLWVASSLCRTRRQPRNHFTDPLSFSLQCHACLPPSSLHCVTGRSSFNMFLCISFTCPDFYFFWQFHSFWSLWASRQGKQKTKTSEHISHLQSSDFSPSPMLKGMLGPVATPLKDQTPCIRWKH